MSSPLLFSQISKAIVKGILKLKAENSSHLLSESANIQLAYKLLRTRDVLKEAIDINVIL